MANINIFGALWNNLSNDWEKIIAYGTQIYGNGESYSESDGLIGDNDLNEVSLSWTEGLVKGNQYDINRFFKAKIGSIQTSIGSIQTNYVPYTGATRNVTLGNYDLSSSGFYLTSAKRFTGFDKPIDSSSNSIGIYILANAGLSNPTYNCIDLADIFKTVKLDISGEQKSIFEHLASLKDKPNNITNPLRFMGVVNSGGSLPASDVSVGDVWHLNVDMTAGDKQYWIGDDVVCTSASPITWELLGANVERIDPSEINVDNLESWSTN